MTTNLVEDDLQLAPLERHLLPCKEQTLAAPNPLQAATEQAHNTRTPSTSATGLFCAWLICSLATTSSNDAARVS